jgi:hypothetical protein
VPNAREENVREEAAVEVAVGAEEAQALRDLTQELMKRVEEAAAGAKEEQV